MIRITDKENKAVPASAARRGAAGCGGQYLPSGKWQNRQRKEWNVPASEMVLETADSYKNKKAKNKTKQKNPPKYTEIKCLFLKGLTLSL